MILNFIRSCVFLILTLLCTLLLGLISLPFLWNKYFALSISIIWVNIMVWLINHILLIKTQLNGEENLPSAQAIIDNGFIIASKHQSAWETIFLHHYFAKRYGKQHTPAFVMKKQLTYIPFFGWFHSAVGNIIIDRKSGATSIKQIISKSESCLNKGKPVIIFPEGTRTKFKETGKYNIGIFALYKAFSQTGQGKQAKQIDAGIGKQQEQVKQTQQIQQVESQEEYKHYKKGGGNEKFAKNEDYAKYMRYKIIPLALKSGKCWGRNSFIKQAGVINAEFFPALEAGLEKNQLMEKLKTKLEKKNF